MSQIDDESITEAFLAAGRDLGVEVVAPYVLMADGRRHKFSAFVPYFGNSKGIVIAAMPSSHALSEAARKVGLGISFVNQEMYGTYGRDHFIDMLTEWGFYGPDEKRPSWLKQSW